MVVSVMFIGYGYILLVMLLAGLKSSADTIVHLHRLDK